MAVGADRDGPGDPDELLKQYQDAAVEARNLRKVVREQDGGLPGWGQSALRWLIPQVAGLVCGLVTLLVYLSPFFDNTGRQQGWHDKVAKTLVVNSK